MLTNEELINIKNILLDGKVISFPTETVMGLGVIYNNQNAYNLLNSVKRRPEDKPYTLMLGDVNKIKEYAYIDSISEKIIQEFMPGEVTLLLKAKSNVPSYVTHNSGIVGIRVPAYKNVCDLINFVGEPLLVPSANRSGEKPCLTYQEVIDAFKGEVSYVLKENSLRNKPSTIIDLTDKEIKIIREGNITLEDIKRRIGLC